MKSCLAEGYPFVFGFSVYDSFESVQGAAWGLQGYFTIPYTYLLDKNLSDDFWTVRQVK